MRHTFALLILAVLSLTPMVRAEKDIRVFPLPVLEALGKELYRRDEMAAHATDLLLETFPAAKQSPIRGWVTEYSKERRMVHFIQQHDAKLSIAYTVDFQKQDAPKIEDRLGVVLPETIGRRYKARLTAIDAIPTFTPGSYNFEVLDDPEGKEFLVYALAATTDPNAVIVGGHYRVTVSADGITALRVDALSRTFLVLQKRPPQKPSGSKITALMMSISSAIRPSKPMCI